MSQGSVTISITLHDARRDPPAKSGDYITYMRGYEGWAKMSYSKRHRAFNAFDSEEIPEFALHVDLWAELPESVPEIPRDTLPDGLEEPDYEALQAQEENQ